MVDLFHEMTKLNSGDYALNIQEINIDECLKEQFYRISTNLITSLLMYYLMRMVRTLVKADRVCLERIINNLISNILKYRHMRKLKFSITKTGCLLKYKMILMNH